MNARKIIADHRYFGGNSGYVGYSKSKRAVQAEEDGKRSLSNIDNEFAEKVSALVGKPIKATTIKKDIKSGDIKTNEWHHTSMYGNKTKYYSVDDVAEYYKEKLTPQDDVKQNLEELASLKIKASELNESLCSEFTNLAELMKLSGVVRLHRNFKLPFGYYYNSKWGEWVYVTSMKPNQEEQEALDKANSIRLDFINKHNGDLEEIKRLEEQFKKGVEGLSDRQYNALNKILYQNI